MIPEESRQNCEDIRAKKDLSCRLRRIRQGQKQKQLRCE